MGKNMWKIPFRVIITSKSKDDFGRLYPVAWNKINLRACIQQGDYRPPGRTRACSRASGFVCSTSQG